MCGNTATRENKSGKPYSFVMHPNGGKQKWAKIGSTYREVDRIEEWDEERFAIDGLDDIFQYAERLKSVVSMYTSE